MSNDVLSRFDQFPLTPEQISYMGHLRLLFKKMAQDILDYCPPGRNQAEALTNLETASMYAIKGLCHGK